MIQAGWLYAHRDCLQDIYAVRRAVFTDEQGFDAGIDRDAYDQTAGHVYVNDEAGRTVATARLFQNEQGEWHAGRFAVLKECRGQGLGDMMLRMILLKASQLSASTLYVSAQLHAAGFYQKFGFSACGPEYLEAGQPHLPMKVDLDQVDWHPACKKSGRDA